MRLRKITLEGTDWLPLSDDYIFKAVLTKPEAKIALMDLISAAIERKVVDVHILNNELATSDVDEKNQRFDIFCNIDDGSQVNVEMQGSKLTEYGGGHDNFINKLVYYLTSAHTGQKSKGVPYADLVKTYQIAFSMHTAFDDYDEFVTRAAIRRENGTLITDQVNMIIIELNKMGAVLSKTADEMNPLEAWSALLGYSQDDDKRGLIDGLIKKSEAMNVAATVLSEISRSPDERAKYMSRQKFEMDNYSNMINSERIGEHRGRIEGRREGRLEERFELARTMKRAGALTLDQISFYSGLSLVDIEKL